MCGIKRIPCIGWQIYASERADRYQRRTYGGMPRTSSKRMREHLIRLRVAFENILSPPRSFVSMAAASCRRGSPAGALQLGQDLLGARTRLGPLLAAARNKRRDLVRRFARRLNGAQASAFHLLQRA